MLDSFVKSDFLLEEYDKSRMDWFADKCDSLSVLPDLVERAQFDYHDETTKVIIEDRVPMMRILRMGIDSFFYEYMDNRDKFSMTTEEVSGHYNKTETVYVLHRGMSSFPTKADIDRVHTGSAGRVLHDIKLRSKNGLKSGKETERYLLMHGYDISGHLTDAAQSLLLYDKVMNHKVIYGQTNSALNGNRLIITSPNSVDNEFLKILYKSYQAGALEIKMDRGFIYLYDSRDLTVQTVKNIRTVKTQDRAITEAAVTLIPRDIKVTYFIVESNRDSPVFLEYFKNNREVSRWFRLEELPNL